MCKGNPLKGSKVWQQLLQIILLILTNKQHIIGVVFFELFELEDRSEPFHFWILFLNLFDCCVELVVSEVEDEEMWSKAVLDVVDLLDISD